MSSVPTGRPRPLNEPATDVPPRTGAAESTWSPSSWRAFPVAQQPEWPDPAALEAARERLRSLPPLVFAGEARALLAALGEVCEGRAFLLQAGDCVESFHDVSASLGGRRHRV